MQSKHLGDVAVVTRRREGGQDGAREKLTLGTVCMVAEASTRADAGRAF